MLTSSTIAPPSSCAATSVSMAERSPARSCSWKTLRPVGLIRSPMMQNGWSSPMTTCLLAELRTGVHVLLLLTGAVTGVAARNVPRTYRRGEWKGVSRGPSYSTSESSGSAGSERCAVPCRPRGARRSRPVSRLVQDASPSSWLLTGGRSSMDVLAPRLREQRQRAASLFCLDPDTTHLWNDLAVAVLTNAAAWPVAQRLGAGHRAGHPCGVQDALAAHSAVPHGTLDGMLDDAAEAWACRFRLW